MGARRLPLDYLLDVMNDASAPPERRDKAAAVALPFCHSRPAEGFLPLGKKEQAQADAQTAGVGSDWGDDLATDYGLPRPRKLNAHG
jgi:hypothetical protein